MESPMHPYANVAPTAPYAGYANMAPVSPYAYENVPPAAPVMAGKMGPVSPVAGYCHAGGGFAFILVLYILLVIVSRVGW